MSYMDEIRRLQTTWSTLDRCTNAPAEPGSEHYTQCRGHEFEWAREVSRSILLGSDEVFGYEDLAISLAVFELDRRNHGEPCDVPALDAYEGDDRPLDSRQPPIQAIEALYGDPYHY